MLVSTFTATHTPSVAPKALQCGIASFEGMESRQYSVWNLKSDLSGLPGNGGAGE